MDLKKENEKTNPTPIEKNVTRRGFLKTAVGLAAAAALPGLPKGWVGGAWAGDGPETTDVRFGLIALTDCASLVMAHERGLFKKYGIHSTLSKEASWAVIRDKLTLGENHATHMLIGMPYASSMGLLGSPKKPMVIPFHLNHNGQAITLQKKFAGKVRSAADLKPFVESAKSAGQPLTFAMTFPSGSHAMWMRYWLASGGIHPDLDVSLITIPPPQMVQNMKIDKMDGFCVGEPWNARAVTDGSGYTVITTQTIWKDHPEKVLAFTADFAEKNPKTVKAIIKALTESSQFIDKMENREQVAEIVSKPQYINCPKEVILGRFRGTYDYGDGRPPVQDPNAMTFFNRNTNFPWKSHGLWWVSQFRRWGMVTGTPDYTGIVDKVHRPDLYREVAKEMGLAVPATDTKKETLFDGKTFDPADPEGYAKSFPIHRLA
ncbi:MAG: ABC transporter substrate-binding protein [Elusimicrobia bacterium]|nr:ABC transporter substrate-binding protein [Elusimicrobiota bacterium]MBP9128558.1 ABC transporter substrate-binding protein [Elusimicrobiota bacterium]